MSIQTFWSEKRWTRKFGEWGKDYTIVKDPRGGGYHIGLDSATVGGIPCLVAGVVVTAYKTGTMGWCVEVDTGESRIGRGRYFTYCHIAGDRVPREGERIEVGARVGRTAMGPRGIPYTSVEFPGTAWYGVHCHLVVSDIRYAAWTVVKGRTLSDFYDPAPIIRQVLSGTAGGDSKPFDPEKPKEWDEMATKDEVKAAVLEALGARPDAVLIHYSGAGRNGIYLAAPGFWHQFTDEQWTQFVNHGMRTGIRELVPVNDRDFDVFREIYAPQTVAPAGLTDAQLAAILGQIKAETKANLSDADLDRIAKAVRGQFAADPLK